MSAPTRGERRERRGIRGWLDPRDRHPGMWAFAASRLTGLGLVAYLYLHLGVLSLLTRGPGSWDGFVRLVRRPAFLAADVLLVVLLLVHGLHGLRVALHGSGLVVGARKSLMVALLTIGVIVALVAAVRLYA